MAAKKPFDKLLHRQYDDKARGATIKCMTKHGYSVTDNPDPYAQDLIAKPTVISELDFSFLVECEVKAVWKTNEFPYSDLQLPERKQKFFDQRTLFFIWNCHLSRAACFWSEHVKHLPTHEVSNKMMAKGERFFKIPLSLIKFVSA
tara:strand:+ start:56 stop:493 length:438 start_codon:yes stop_codon:yes gene_type:complete